MILTVNFYKDLCQDCMPTAECFYKNSLPMLQEHWQMEIMQKEHYLLFGL